MFNYEKKIVAGLASKICDELGVIWATDALIAPLIDTDIEKAFEGVKTPSRGAISSYQIKSVRSQYENQANFAFNIGLYQATTDESETQELEQKAEIFIRTLEREIYDYTSERFDAEVEIIEMETRYNLYPGARLINVFFTGVNRASA